MINIRNSGVKFAKRLVFLCACIATPVSAGPPFQWDSFDLNVSHSKCIDRASAAIASEIVVDKVKKRPNGAAAWNKNTSIVVHCVGVGPNKTKSIIFVSGFKDKGLKDTLGQIRATMKSGVFE